jgi:hypothetical protein
MEAVVVVLLVVTIVLLLGAVGGGGGRRGNEPPVSSQPPQAPRGTDADLEAHILRREDAAFVEGMVIGHYVWPARPRDDDREQVDHRDDELAWALGDDGDAYLPDGEEDEALDDLDPDIGFGIGYEGGFGEAAELDEFDAEDADEAGWGDGFDDPWDDGFDDED